MLTLDEDALMEMSNTMNRLMLCGQLMKGPVMSHMVPQALSHNSSITIHGCVLADIVLKISTNYKTNNYTFYALYF